VIVPLVKSVVPPEAEIAVIASVAVFVLVVLISAAPLVAAVGVCEGLAIIAKVFVPVPAEMVQGIWHCHAHAFATAGSDQLQTGVAVLTVSVMSVVTRQELPFRRSADSLRAAVVSIDNVLPFATDSLIPIAADPLAAVVELKR
jgi:hypothetical protein